MKVVFAAVTGEGHVSPLLGLADAFVRRGHEVVFATAPDMHAQLAGRGFVLRRAGVTGDEQRVALAPKLPGLAPRDGIRLSYSFTFPQVHAPRMVRDLFAVVDDVQPQMLVCDSAEFATPLVAALRGLPWAHHSYGVLRPEFAWSLAAQAVAPLWRQYGLTAPERAGMFDGIYLDVCPPTLQTPEIDSVPRPLALRPAVVPESMPGTRHVRRRPRVLMTFGTVFNRAPEMLAAVARAASRAGADVTLTTGPGVDVASLGDIGGARVVEYVPLADVLPACDAVITHGGSGTMLAALALGVPLVVLPRGADHFLNAERLQAAGAAIAVDEPDDVADGLALVLGDDRYRDAAREVGAELRRMPAPDDVVAQLTEQVTDSESR